MERYFEQLVAVREGRVVDSDPEDELALHIRLAKEYQRHPERFVISYLGLPYVVRYAHTDPQKELVS